MSISQHLIRVGMRVQWLGADSAEGIYSDAFRRQGKILKQGHPGTVRRTDNVDHIQVDWCGLEEEDESIMMGYNRFANGDYGQLGELTEQEWQDRVRTGGWWAEE